MTRLEIDGIRKRSKSPDKGPWQTDFNEMSKKTVVHRASKVWPLDASFKEALEVQEVKEAQIDLAPLPAVIDDEPVKSISAPDDSNPELNPSGPATKETPAQLAKRAVLEAGVPLDLFVADVTARNIALDAEAWQSLETVPAGVWESLANQPKVLQAICKKWGKKQE